MAEVKDAKQLKSGKWVRNTNLEDNIIYDNSEYKKLMKYYSNSVHKNASKEKKLREFLKKLVTEGYTLDTINKNYEITLVDDKYELKQKYSEENTNNQGNGKISEIEVLSNSNSENEDLGDESLGLSESIEENIINGQNMNNENGQNLDGDLFNLKNLEENQKKNLEKYDNMLDVIDEAKKIERQEQLERMEREKDERRKQFKQNYEKEKEIIRQREINKKKLFQEVQQYDKEDNNQEQKAQPETNIEQIQQEDMGIDFKLKKKESSTKKQKEYNFFQSDDEDDEDEDEQEEEINDEGNQQDDSVSHGSSIRLDQNEEKLYQFQKDQMENNKDVFEDNYNHEIRNQMYEENQQFETNGQNGQSEQSEQHIQQNGDDIHNNNSINNIQYNTQNGKLNKQMNGNQSKKNSKKSKIQLKSDQKSLEKNLQNQKQQENFLDESNIFLNYYEESHKLVLQQLQEKEKELKEKEQQKQNLKNGKQQKEKKIYNKSHIKEILKDVTEGNLHGFFSYEQNETHINVFLGYDRISEKQKQIIDQFKKIFSEDPKFKKFNEERMKKQFNLNKSCKNGNYNSNVHNNTNNTNNNTINNTNNKQDNPLVQ